jgi:hypothetical protein
MTKNSVFHKITPLEKINSFILLFFYAFDLRNKATLGYQ